MRNLIGAVTGIIAGGGILLAISGQIWFALLALPAILYIGWLLFDYNN